MSYLLLILATLAAAFTLVLCILVLGLWMKGVGALALPGLGIIVAMPLLLMALLFLEIAFVLLAAYLVRFLPFARLLLGEVDGIQG